MDDGRFGRKADGSVLTGAVEKVFDIEDRKIHFPVPALDEFGKALVEFLDAGFIAFQMDFVSSRRDFEIREIPAESV